MILKGDKIPLSCLNENQVSQLCTDGGRALYSAMLWEKKELVDIGVNDRLLAIRVQQHTLESIS